MLKNLDPLLTPDLLAHLAAMGHGDTIAIVNRNYPATSEARRLVTMPGINATEISRSILSVLPVDASTEHAVYHMAPADPTTTPPVHEEFQTLLNEAESRDVPVEALNRADFHQRTESAYAVVLTGENRSFGCFVITKGVIS